MTFLELCTTLRQESGIAGAGPTTTSGQSGELERIVNWVKQAYVDIQDNNASWRFLRATFSFNCTPSVQSYNASSVPLIANWKPLSIRLYLTTVANEWFIDYVPWEEFRESRLFGTARTQTGRPVECTINPANELVFWPIPDVAYTISGEYFRTAHTFTADSDTPLFPRFHMCIVFNALKRYASYVSDPSIYAYAQAEYAKVYARLENEQLEQIKFSGSLA